MAILNYLEWYISVEWMVGRYSRVGPPRTQACLQNDSLREYNQLVLINIYRSGAAMETLFVE